jgi:predicted ester cyclase
MVELQMVFDAFPDIVFRPVRHIKQSDRHLLEFRAFGTHRGEFLSVPPTNTTAIVSGVFNLQSDDGVIRRLRMTVDFGGLRRQLLVASRRQRVVSERPTIQMTIFHKGGKE